MMDELTTSDCRSREPALDVRARVHGLLVEEFELAESDLVADANLYTDLGLDSLDSVDLVVALKEEFGFAVDRSKDEKRIREVQTLEHLYAFVNEKMDGQEAHGE